MLQIICHRKRAVYLLGKKRLFQILFCAGYFFLFMPLFVIVVFSFNASTTMSWQGFSLQWYKELWQNRLLIDSAFVSCKVAACAATGATVLGTVCASQWNHRRIFHRSLGMIASLPLVIPEVVMGMSFLLFWVYLMDIFPFLSRGFWSLVSAHTMLGAAYVTALVRARLSLIAVNLSEAAMDLGARPYKVFFLIKLPLIVPSLVAGWLLSFILSFDDMVLASFTAGPGYTTLPLTIFSRLKVGYSPQVNALGSCVVFLVSLLMVIVWYIIYRKSSVSQNGSP